MSLVCFFTTYKAGHNQRLFDHSTQCSKLSVLLSLSVRTHLFLQCSVADSDLDPDTDLHGSAFILGNADPDPGASKSHRHTAGGSFSPLAEGKMTE